MDTSEQDPVPPVQEPVPVQDPVPPVWDPEEDIEEDDSNPVGIMPHPPQPLLPAPPRGGIPGRFPPPGMIPPRGVAPPGMIPPRPPMGHMPFPMHQVIHIVLLRLY